MDRFFAPCSRPSSSPSPSSRFHRPLSSNAIIVTRKVTRAHEHPLCASSLGNSRVRSQATIATRISLREGTRWIAARCESRAISNSRIRQLLAAHSNRSSCRSLRTAGSLPRSARILRVDGTCYIPYKLIVHKARDLASRRDDVGRDASDKRTRVSRLASVLVRCEEVVHPSW